jgi:hypothetical protein
LQKQTKCNAGSLGICHWYLPVVGTVLAMDAGQKDENKSDSTAESRHDAGMKIA